MFCKKCGYKIMGKDKICSNCGASAELAESCGGFYSIVDKNKPDQNIKAVETVKTVYVKPEEESFGLKDKIFLALLAINMGLCLFSIFLCIHQYKKVNAYVDEELNEMERKVNNLSEVYNEITTTVDDDISDSVGMGDKIDRAPEEDNTSFDSRKGSPTDSYKRSPTEAVKKDIKENKEENSYDHE